MIRIKCRTCGTSLDYADDITDFRCVFCNSFWTVLHTGDGEIELKPYEDRSEKKPLSRESINSIRLLKIKNQISRLEQRKRVIHPDPKRKNPKFIEEFERYQEYLRRKTAFWENGPGRRIIVAITFLVIITSVFIFLLGKVQPVVLKTLVIVFLLDSLYLLFLSKTVPWPVEPAITAEKYLPDPVWKKKNQDKIREMDEKIEQLKQKAEEMEREAEEMEREEVNGVSEPVQKI